MRAGFNRRFPPFSTQRYLVIWLAGFVPLVVISTLMTALAWLLVPLVKIERIARTLDDRPVEWRVSLCHLEHAHYQARTR